MNRFKRNDYVRATGADDKCPYGLVNGKVYVVVKVNDNLISLEGLTAWFFDYRFEPAFEAAQLTPAEASTTVLGTQIGGSHYTDCAIQPIEYIWANKLGFSEGNIIKYVTRWRTKGGVKDLEKAKHHIALLIERTLADEAKGGL